MTHGLARQRSTLFYLNNSFNLDLTQKGFLTFFFDLINHGLTKFPTCLSNFIGTLIYSLISSILALQNDFGLRKQSTRPRTLCWPARLQWKLLKLQNRFGIIICIKFLTNNLKLFRCQNASKFLKEEGEVIREANIPGYTGFHKTMNSLQHMPFLFV